MNEVHSRLLVCPQTQRSLEIKEISAEEDGRIQTGTLIEPNSRTEYPIVDWIPRFVSNENYSNSFGFQWKKHALTQHDSYSGLDISQKRFLEETKWAHDLEGELVLEAGSGAGRFTSHALSTGATVVSFDYSDAVAANYEINGSHPNLLLVQADIYCMPFACNFFDRAFCFGVLQHTPEPEEAFLSIIRHLKPGGKIASDVYFKSLRGLLHMKTWLRPLTKNQEPERLYQFVKKYVDVLWPLARILRGTHVGRKLVSRLVADRSDYMQGAPDAMLKEWAYLDTFDWLSPAYDNP